VGQHGVAEGGGPPSGGGGEEGGGGCGEEGGEGGGGGRDCLGCMKCGAGRIAQPPCHFLFGNGGWINLLTPLMLSIHLELSTHHLIPLTPLAHRDYHKFSDSFDAVNSSGTITNLLTPSMLSTHREFDHRTMEESFWIGVFKVAVFEFLNEFVEVLRCDYGENGTEIVGVEHNDSGVSFGNEP